MRTNPCRRRRLRLTDKTPKERLRHLATRMSRRMIVAERERLCPRGRGHHHPTQACGAAAQKYPLSLVGGESKMSPSADRHGQFRSPPGPKRCPTRILRCKKGDSKPPEATMANQKMPQRNNTGAVKPDAADASSFLGSIVGSRRTP